jgi:hypothetical protein
MSAAASVGAMAGASIARLQQKIKEFKEFGHHFIEEGKVSKEATFKYMEGVQLVDNKFKFLEKELWKQAPFLRKTEQGTYWIDVEAYQQYLFNHSDPRRPFLIAWAIAILLIGIGALILFFNY